MKASLRSPWTHEEDATLKDAIEKHGASSWTNIAQYLPNRTNKQCRERWVNHLAPNICKSPWTSREDQFMYNLHQIYGNRWSIIAQHLPGRTDQQVKNRFYLMMHRKFRSIRKKNLVRAETTPKETPQNIRNESKMIYSSFLAHKSLLDPVHLTVNSTPLLPYFSPPNATSNPFADEMKVFPSNTPNIENNASIEKRWCPKISPHLLNSNFELLKNQPDGSLIQCKIDISEKKKGNNTYNIQEITQSKNSFYSPIFGHQKIKHEEYLATIIEQQSTFTYNNQHLELKYQYRQSTR